jgi:integrase
MGTLVVGLSRSTQTPLDSLPRHKRGPQPRTLRRKAGLAGFQFHDLRHHAITELAESGASDQTIMSIAGHVSREMLERYSHIRLEAKRRAVEVLSQKAKSGSTSQTTSQMEYRGRPRKPQVQEKIGRGERI